QNSKNCSSVMSTAGRKWTTSGAYSTTIEAVMASMMTRHAIERGLRPLLRVLLAMAVDAPAHGERADDRTCADEIDQVVRDEVAQAVGAHAGHALDGA